MPKLCKAVITIDDLTQSLLSVQVGLPRRVYDVLLISIETSEDLAFNS